MENEIPTSGGTPPPVSNNYESLNAFISAADTALTNAQLPDIAPLLEKVGIKPADIISKIADLKTLRSLAEKQVKEYGDQYDASGNYQKQLTLLEAEYPDHVALARLEFEGNIAALTTLGLNGRRKRSRNDYSKQALLLYNGALTNAGYAATLAGVNIDTAKLQAMQTGYTLLETLDKTQTKETGEAQQATADRDKAWDELEEWMHKFYKKAKIALKNYPQLREKLGMVER